MINKSEFINKMPYKSTGTAGKSASGASMSKYDMEVEERLQALESVVHDHGETSSDATLEEKVAKIINWLEHNTSFYGS